MSTIRAPPVQVMADDEWVPYTPAIADARPLSAGRGWTRQAYRARGVSNDQAATFARLGLSPDLVPVLTNGNLTETDVVFLANTLSRGGIRVMHSTGRLHTGAVAGLSSIADRHNGARAAAWVHQTVMSMVEANDLDGWGVRPSSIAAWIRADPLRRPHRPHSMLRTAHVALGVPTSDMDAWLRFAVRHDVPYFGTADHLGFLGGDTALMVAAGISPQEASRMVRTGRFNRDAVAMLAGLRS